jgi:hypothetical protein
MLQHDVSGGYATRSIAIDAGDNAVAGRRNPRREPRLEIRAVFKDRELRITQFEEFAS